MASRRRLIPGKGPFKGQSRGHRYTPEFEAVVHDAIGKLVRDPAIPNESITWETIRVAIPEEFRPNEKGFGSNNYLKEFLGRIAFREGLDIRQIKIASKEARYRKK